MKILIKSTVYVTALLYMQGCVSPKQLTDALTQLQIMDNICISTVSYQIKPSQKSPADSVIEFSAVLTNPSAGDGHGIVRLLMGVDATNLALANGTNSISTDNSPFRETPMGTIFPANRVPYISPVLITLPYTRGAIYQVEIRKFIPPQLDADISPCHIFKITLHPRT